MLAKLKNEALGKWDIEDGNSDFCIYILRNLLSDWLFKESSLESMEPGGSAPLAAQH